jgi:hypothetical protein
MHRRAAFSVVVLGLAAGCEGPTATPAHIGVAGAHASLEKGGSAQECAGLLVGGPFKNVVVPPGGHCLLVRARVTGNVRALEGSNLTTSGNDISGNVVVDRGAFVNMSSDVVGGNVSIVGGVGSTGGVHAFSYRIDGLRLRDGNIYIARNSGGITVRFSEITKGSIRIEDNLSSTLFAVTDNNVRKHILLHRNLGSAVKTVLSNLAGKSIRCYDNEPPIFAELNSAPRLEGQCAVPAASP